MIFRLDKRLLFPALALAEPDGLLAVGGDLSVNRLLLAYNNGIFPWYNEPPILWYSPPERFVLYPGELRVTKSMRKVFRLNKFGVTVDTCFEDVINACSLAPREGQDGTWINEDMKNAYTRLYKKGHAHSIEVWEKDQLVGGLYGVAVGKVFCGESMFSKVSNASKTALIYLCNSGLYNLIDCQLHTQHLQSMGAKMISRAEYLGILRE